MVDPLVTPDPVCVFEGIKNSSSFTQCDPPKRVWQKNGTQNKPITIKTSYPSSSYIELKKYNVIQKDRERLLTIQDNSLSMVPPMKINRNNYNVFRVFVQDPFELG